MNVQEMRFHNTLLNVKMSNNKENSMRASTLDVTVEEEDGTGVSDI